MRTNALIRIILYTIGILVLSGILLAGLGLRLFSVSGMTQEITHSAQSGDTYTCTADADQLKNIEIEWAAGTITIEPSEDVEEIQIQETAVAEKDRMVCKTSGNTLSIQFSKPTFGSVSFGVDGVPKDLVILVPTGWVCRTLEMDVASADVNIQNMTIGELDFDGASGLCNLENCHVTDMDVDVASGDLDFDGRLDTLDFDGASADCTLHLTNCPSHIDLDGMSGKLNITLPSDCGFTVSTEGLSAEFSTDFDTISRGNAHVHGDGSCLIEIDALSGRVAIHDGGYNCHDTDKNHSQGHHSVHH